MEAVAAASPALGASLPSSSSSTTALQVLLLTVMFVYLAQTLRPRWQSTCTTAPLPPGPTPWPVVGNLPEMLLSDKPAFRWIHHVMKEMGTDIACVKLGGVHVIPITCPKIARKVLKKQDANFASRPLTLASKTFSRGYMDAVMSPCGDHWRKMRRVLAAEVVCPSRHTWLHGKRSDEADNLTRYVYNLAGGGTGGGAVDLRHVARHYCGNVVRRLIFNRRYFGEAQPDGGPGPLEMQHVDAVFASVGLLYSFRVSDYLPWLLGLDLDGHEKMVKDTNRTVNTLHDTFVDERWRQWKSGERRELEDLLDVLITLKDAEACRPVLSIEEVKALLQDITFAAMDNPSNAVEWALGEMVSRPELMKKAVEELDGVVGRDRLVQEADIPRLNYLKACIREAFRLHPVAPFNVPHVAREDATVAGYHIPKGSHVILSRVGLGRNPAVWDEPLRFNPDRHLAADPTAAVTLAENDLRFISFSTGRRGCIAASLGTAMSIMLFGRLLQGFSWSKPAGMTAVDLSESRHDLFMAKPLVLHAVPRLPAHLYSLASSVQFV